MNNTRHQIESRVKAETIAASNRKIFAGLSLLAILIAGMFLAIGTSTARSAQYPACEAVPVEFRIIREFNWAERKTWQRGYQMVRFSGAHEHRTIQYSGSEVSRRYCMAKAHFTNGEHRTVYYMISDVGGFVGLNWDVTHCVIGLDPWRNHDGDCRAIR